MTQPEISALKEKAQKATPGKWTCHGGIYVHSRDTMVADNNDESAIARARGVGGGMSRQQQESNVEFIAAAHPQAILALIEMNEKMREALEFYKGNFDGKEGSYWLDGYKFIQEDKFGDTKHFDNGDRARQTIALFDGEVKA